MTRGQVAVLAALAALVLAIYSILGLLVAGRIPIGLPPAPTDMPQPTATVVPLPGTSRQNPMPFGQSVVSGDLEIRILGVRRDAWSLISPLNAALPDSQEVALLQIEVQNLSANPVSVSPGTFRLTGDRGHLYQRPALILDDELRGEVQASGILTGALAFVVSRGEGNLALVYMPSDTIPDPNARWLWADEDPSPQAFATTFLSPTASPRAGGSRLAPALMDQPVVADDRLEIQVLSVVRDAWPTIQEMSPLNQPPEPGKEYVLVRLKTHFLGEDDQLLAVNWWSFRMTGSENILYTNPSLILQDELGGGLFPGGDLEGVLAFQVRQGEKNLILVYDPTGVGAKMGRGVRWLWATDEPDYALLQTPIVASSALAVSGRSAEQPAPVGVPVLTEGQIEVSVERAILLTQDATEWDGWPLPTAGPPRPYLILTVKARNLSSEERPQTIAWQGFKVQDPYGAAISGPVVLGGSELDGESFPGASMTAYLVFSVANGRRFILSYDPTGLGVPNAFRWFVVEV